MKLQKNEKGNKEITQQKCQKSKIQIKWNRFLSKTFSRMHHVVLSLRHPLDTGLKIKSNLLELILSTSGAKARKSSNRASWDWFCRLLAPRPESHQIEPPGTGSVGSDTTIHKERDSLYRSCLAKRFNKRHFAKDPPTIVPVDYSFPDAFWESSDSRNIDFEKPRKN